MDADAEAPAAAAAPGAMDADAEAPAAAARSNNECARIVDASSVKVTQPGGVSIKFSSRHKAKRELPSCR